MRPRVTLVDDEPLTPIQRLFTVADCANGLGTKIDIRRWTFLNTDMSVHLYRVPTGEWTGIRAETFYGPDGIGTTVGTLFDDDGPVVEGGLGHDVGLPLRDCAHTEVDHAQPLSGNLAGSHFTQRPASVRAGRPPCGHRP